MKLFIVCALVLALPLSAHSSRCLDVFVENPADSEQRALVLLKNYDKGVDGIESKNFSASKEELLDFKKPNSSFRVLMIINRTGIFHDLMELLVGDHIFNSRSLENKIFIQKAEVSFQKGRNYLHSLPDVAKLIKIIKKGKLSLLAQEQLIEVMKVYSHIISELYGREI